MGLRAIFDSSYSKFWIEQSKFFFFIKTLWRTIIDPSLSINKCIIEKGLTNINSGLWLVGKPTITTSKHKNYIKKTTKHSKLTQDSSEMCWDCLLGQQYGSLSLYSGYSSTLHPLALFIFLCSAGFVALMCILFRKVNSLYLSLSKR